MQAFSKEVTDLRDGQRPGKQIALPVLTAQRLQLVELPDVFDPFGNDRQIKRLGEVNNGPDDLAIFRTKLDRAHKRTVDLESIDRKPVQITQARVPSAEIVNA